MKIFGIEIRKASKKEISETTASGYTGNRLFLGSRENAMLLSTVYRCVDVISDAVAQLPLETFSIDSEGFKRPFIDHPVYSLMNDEPNEDMTRFTFFKTMVASILLKGNAYAYIERDSRGNAIQLIYLQSHQVNIVWILDSLGIKRKRYQVVGFKDMVEPKDMIHFLNFSYDGIIGVSTLEHARQTLGISTDSETHAAKFFKGGANMAGVLTIEGTRLNQDQKNQNYKEWSARTDPATGNPNGIVILEGNMRYQPITINPKDSQLLESRQFNVVDVCRFFSVSPVKAFDLSNSSYATVEATQLGFLTDTAAPILTKIELELNRKLFKKSEKGKVKSEFNTTGFLRADKAAQGTYLNQMFQIGAMTPNEIRRENNLPKVEFGDNAFVQVNIQPLEKAVKLNAIDSEKNVKKK
ncbi:phage portal protein [Dysgonomonas sp. Marseille-P4677]|uniref:phage portal protein n=1 Tax=Dysgonomonas sp. Marseille-P4677 TaxID=2364790 RepID=UPI0019143F7A|nr:phage portal protein [Dysgonomonas sp. Marseille-P4677]MBK5721368.1 phage portal protein [Dysgonomonas sp. Marseille-P4677]